MVGGSLPCGHYLAEEAPQALLAQDYWLLRVQDAEIELLRNTVEAFQRSLQLTQNQYKAGIVALPFGVSIIIASLVTAAIAVVIGVGALRVRGLLLAVVTFAFAVSMEEFLFQNPGVNGGFAGPTAPNGWFTTVSTNGVIPGWVEALQLMPVGSKWRIVVPPDLAYKERGAGNRIGPNEALIFEVELISKDPS